MSNILSGFRKQKRYTTNNKGQHQLISTWTHTDTVYDDEGKSLTEIIEELPAADKKVQQTATDDTNANYEILFSESADNVTKSEEARKSSRLLYNPGTKKLSLAESKLEVTGSNNGTTEVGGGSMTISRNNNLIEPQLSIYNEHSGGEALLRSNNIQIRDDYTSPTKVMEIQQEDIVLTGGTWDGTHTSLKSAVSASTSDVNVTQTPSTTNSNFEILLSGSADNTEHTEGTKKSDTLKYNPYANTLNITGFDSYTTTIDNKRVYFEDPQESSRFVQLGFNGGNYANLELNDTVGNMTLTSLDIEFNTGQTWDGTHSSLKDAIAASGTDEKVKQVPTDTGNYNYEVLFGGINNTEETNTVHKTQYLTYNATNKTLQLSNGTKHIRLDGNGDITLTNDTWDGTNTSLKTALANAGSANILSGLSAPTSQQGNNGDLYVRLKALNPYLEDFTVNYDVLPSTGVSTELDTTNLNECNVSVKQYRMVSNVETLIYECTEVIDFSTTSSGTIQDENQDYVMSFSCDPNGILFLQKPNQQDKLVVTITDTNATADAIDTIYIKDSGSWLQDDGEIPSPTASDVGKVLKATDVGEYDWAVDAGGSEAVYKTLAEYEALTTAQKEDPTKIYFVINEGTKVSPTLAADDGNCNATNAPTYAWWCLSGNVSTEFQISDGGLSEYNSPAWWSYHFSTRQIFSKVKMRYRNNSSENRVRFSIQASNNGSTWTEILNGSPKYMDLTTENTDMEFVLDTGNVAYEYIRLRFDMPSGWAAGAIKICGNLEIFATANSSSPMIYYKNMLYTPNELPITSTSDTGKILAVNADGVWDKATNNGIIPVRLSKAAYDALTPAQKADESKLYLIDGSIITDETLISPDDLATDDGNVISSGGSMYGDSNRQPWTCFDAYDVTSGSYNNYWTPAQNAVPVIGYHFTDKPHKITKVKIRLVSNQGDTTNSVYVEGSNDGTNWIDISKNGGTTSVAVTETEGYHDTEIETGFDAAYSYVRIRFSSAVNVSYSGKFVGLDAVKIYATETAKVYNAICYNGSEYASLDPNHYFKEISQADYDLLPETKNSDGIIYFITDYS